MSELEMMVDAVLLDPMATARARARQGQRVIGYVGAEIPVEVILAAGAFPLRLPGRVQATDQADRYLESRFTHDLRSIAEQYLQGQFDFLDSIVFPRSDDSAQRVYYYLCELRRRGLVGGPLPLIFDAALIPRDSSRRHTHRATARLADELAMDPSALTAAIERRNRRRELYAAAAGLRLRRSLSGAALDRIFRAADLCDADSFDAAFGEWLEAAPPRAAGPRLLLSGSAPPDDRLHRAAESAGANIVAEWGAHGSCAVSAPLIDAAGSLPDVADHYQSLRFGLRAFDARAAATVRLAKEVEAVGVVIWLTEQEEALIWDLPSQVAALTAEGIAVLALARQLWNDEGTAADQIASFASNLTRAA
jgi:benzoyl-CoA reductase/2-hydroxyglutaryl-CoA dehydratase subunit BcrC/BadD/HgdB